MCGGVPRGCSNMIEDDESLHGSRKRAAAEQEGMGVAGGCIDAAGDTLWY